MTPRDRAVAKRIREWLSYAAEDLSIAEDLLSRQKSYLRGIGFHSQQAAEMCVKALLTWRQTNFPKTHDIEELLDLLQGSDAVLAESLRPAIVLTRYAVETRYPAPEGVPSPDEAVQAVALARRVRDAVLAVLKDIP